VHGPAIVPRHLRIETGEREIAVDLCEPRARRGARVPFVRGDSEVEILGEAWETVQQPERNGPITEAVIEAAPNRDLLSRRPTDNIEVATGGFWRNVGGSLLVPERAKWCRTADSDSADLCRRADDLTLTSLVWSVMGSDPRTSAFCTVLGV
jgi:hypothetical protein